MTQPGPLALASSAQSQPPQKALAEAAPADSVAEPEPEQTLAQSDRVPTPDEIFQFHTKGAHGDTWRQPFLIDPNDGPLKIRRWTSEELAAADAQRLTIGLHDAKQNKASAKILSDRRKLPPGETKPATDP